MLNSDISYRLYKGKERGRVYPSAIASIMPANRRNSFRHTNTFFFPELVLYKLLLFAEEIWRLGSSHNDQVALFLFRESCSYIHFFATNEHIQFSNGPKFGPLASSFSNILSVYLVCRGLRYYSSTYL